MSDSVNKSVSDWYVDKWSISWDSVNIVLIYKKLLSLYV